MLMSGHLVSSSTHCTTQESRAEEVSNKLSNLKREEKNRAKKIQDVERTIQSVQADLAKPIQVESMTEIDDEMVRLCPFVECTFPNLWSASP
jgi:hypothetical protein